MATKIYNFKVGDIVRITNPTPGSTRDRDKVGIITSITDSSVYDHSWPIILAGVDLIFPFFKPEELELVTKKELPLWQLKLNLPNLK